jgi:hypothetical protein
MTIEIKFRVFRATDDPETCKKFIEGHKKVLSIYGIENITTNTDAWMYNPAIFVIVAESPDGTKLYGGARLQAANGKVPLPIEEATGKMDPKVYDVVKEYAPEGVGELSGLWNSKEVAGFGIGSMYLARIAGAIASQVGLKVILTLCAPATVRFQKFIGGIVLERIGNKGTFYYPKLDLIATAVYTEDAFGLPLAHPRERDYMLWLRANPSAMVEEKSPFNKELLVKISYHITISGADPAEFKIQPDTHNWHY